MSRPRARSTMSIILTRVGCTRANELPVRGYANRVNSSTSRRQRVGKTGNAWYVPATNADVTPDELNEDDDESSNTCTEQKRDVRQELIDDFSDVVESDVEQVGRMFVEVIEEVREEQAKRDLPGSSEDKKLYMLFETNHPDLEIPDNDASEVEKAHTASRLIRRFKHRWSIENGFKQIKSFRVRTTAMNHEYRFFNFLYACTLYNVWRLVDSLVKLELQAEDEFSHKPLVTADFFLTIAKQYNPVGLDPPPE